MTPALMQLCHSRFLPHGVRNLPLHGVPGRVFSGAVVKKLAAQHGSAGAVPRLLTAPPRIDQLVRGAECLRYLSHALRHQGREMPQYDRDDAVCWHGHWGRVPGSRLQRGRQLPARFAYPRLLPTVPMPCKQCCTVGVRL